MKTKIVCPVKKMARNREDRTAILVSGIQISYPELDCLIASAIDWFKKIGIKKNCRAAIISDNCIEYVIALFALWRMNAVACPLTPRLPLRAVQSVLTKINCDTLFLSSNITSLRFVSNRVFQLKSILDLEVDEQAASKEDSISLTQPATIMFTSGSSSEPKAVLHSYGNHYYSALGSNQNLSFGKKDRWLLSLPLYHVGGMGILFRTFLRGGCLVIPQGDESLGDAIRRYTITHVSMVPTQLYRLLKNKTSLKSSRALKAILIGGSAVPQNLILQAINCRLPIRTTYGLTEMTSQVTATPRKAARKRLFTSGRALRYRKIRIASNGEVLVKGKTLFKGYVNGNQTTLPLTKDGWFKTGDLGAIDQEGYLTLLGRTDRMFISGGENIQPEEIERALSAFMGITQAAVVPIQSGEFGFRPVAFIKTWQGKNRIRVSVIRDYLKSCLPKFKIPETFYQWPEGLEERGFKVNRNSLEDLAQNQSQKLIPFQ